MNKKFTKLMAALALLTFLAAPLGMWGQTTTLVSGSGTSGYSIPEGWTKSGTVEGGQYLKFDDGTITSPQFEPHNELSFSYSVATFGSGTNHPLTIRILNASTNAVILEQTTVTPTSSSYTSPESPLSLGDVTVAFKIQMYGPTGKGVRLRNYSVTGTPASGGTTYTVSFNAGAGTFVGNTDFPNASNTVAAGTYTLPSATPVSGYTFNGWVLGEDTYQGGASYTVSGDADFTASYTQNSGGSGGTVTLTQSNLGLTGSYTTNTSKTIEGITYVYSNLMKSTDYIQAKATTGTIKNTTAYPGNITSVAITHSGTANVTTINGSADGTNWTQVETGSGSITADFSGMGYKYFQITRGSNVAYWEKIDITYEGTSSIATPTFSPAGGTYTTAQNVTITCETEGASIYYTTDGSTPTNTSLQYTSAINVTETTTIKAIAYVGDEASSVASATYVLPLSSMQAIFDKATAIGGTAQTVNITFNNWVVSGKSTSYAYVTDGTKGFVITNYGGHGFNAGDVLSGTVSCSLRLYYGYANLQNFSSTAEGLTVASGGTVETANIDMADLSGVNSGALVHYDNLTCRKNGSNFYLGDGTTEIQVYTTLYTGFSNYLVDGKLYNITGVYQQYNTTKEICPRSADDIEEVIVTNPTVTVTPSTIDAPFAGADGTLAITYENITEIISFDYYFCDANGNELEDTDPDYPGDWIYAEINDENEAYTLSYIIDANDGAARTAYMKVYTLDDEAEVVSAIVTVNQAKYVVDYATLPFAFNGGKNAIEETNGLTQSGLGSDYADENTKLKFDGTDDYVILKINERPGILTFYIKGNSFSGGTFKVQTSADGVSYSDLTTYDTFGNNETFEVVFDDLNENVRYIKWVYTYKSSGNVGLGNIALDKYVAPPASITVSNDLVEVDAEEHDGTLDLAYESLTITDMTDFNIQFCDANGNELSEAPDWIEVLVAEQDPTIGEGYVVSYYMVENEGAARTAYFKVYAMDEETNIVYSNLVTITQAAPVVPPTPSNWVLTNLADLTSADVFVIVGNGSYAIANDGTSNPRAVNVTVSGNTLSGTIADNIQWNISGNNTVGYTFYPAGSATTWLYCNTTTSSSNNTNMRVGNGGSNNRNKFEFDNNNQLSTKDSYTKRYLALNGSSDWRGYVSNETNTTTIAFYKKVSENVVSYTKEITGHGGNNDGGWNLIASPVASVTPSSNNGFIASTNEKYDLYYFDQTAAKEWKNYKANSFNLVSGQGYLYANENTVTLTFEGQPYNGNGIVSLTYSNANEDENMRGWNLIGNPFSTAATLNMPFFKMNGTGSGFTSQNANCSVAAMEGVLVYAYDDDASQPISTATFTAAGRSNSESAAMVNIDVVSSFGDVMDNAIVNFNEGIQLPKFYFGTQNANIYIPQGNKEYAIVNTEAQGEMPVSFRAAKNGTYTLTVNPEGVEMNYLHLIDNMTGADIDLLAATSTGSVATYTFNASTTDYSSRFRLVFAANNEDGVSTGSTAFAFYSNGTWVINNIGEATLQVVDVNGRILSNETVNGSVSKAINAPAGVYMLRLINGNDVKTQKIVVR